MEEMRNSYKILVRNLKERDRLGVLGVDGRTILKCIVKMKHEGVYWIRLAQNIYHWRIFLKTAIDFRIL
jgi:hypothetical protein